MKSSKIFLCLLLIVAPRLFSSGISSYPYSGFGMTQNTSNYGIAFYSNIFPLCESILNPIDREEPVKEKIKCDTAKQFNLNEILAWHKHRSEELKKDNGWLTLAGLKWLNEGTNKIKSIGTIILKEGIVSVQISSRFKAKIAGKPFSSGVLKTDALPAGPDKIEINSRAFIIIKRGEKFAVRIWDKNAETRKHFTGIKHFPISEIWCIEAQWQKYDSSKKVKIASVIPGYIEEYTVPGAAIFTISGKEYKFEPVQDPGSKTLFFIFSDKTNGKETYNSGRFLYSEPPKDGKVILDFNKAHNPPCAFTSFATCPLPPESNRLEVRIEAGEKKYGDHK